MGTLKTAMDLNSPVAKKLMQVFSPDDVFKQFLLDMQIEERRVKETAPMLIECLSHFECEKCGECCRDSAVELKEDDALRLAKRDRDRFFASLDENVTYCNALKAPCGYLKGNTCEVNDIKPLVCALYPFSFKYLGMLTLHLCPMGKKIAPELNKATVEYFSNKPVLARREKKQIEEEAKLIVEFNKSFLNDVYSLLGDPPIKGRMLEEMVLSFSAIPVFLKHLKKARSHGHTGNRG